MERIPITRAEGLKAFNTGQFVVVNYNRIDRPRPLAVFKTESEAEAFIRSMPLAKTGRDAITHKDRRPRIFLYKCEKNGS